MTRNSWLRAIGLVQYRDRAEKKEGLQTIIRCDIKMVRQDYNSLSGSKLKQENGDMYDSNTMTQTFQV